MKNAYFKYAAELLLFGLNGIGASDVALSSYEIVFARTLIASLFLILMFSLSRQKVHLGTVRSHLFFLVVSGVVGGRPTGGCSTG